MEPANLGQIVENLKGEENRLCQQKTDCEKRLKSIDVELLRIRAGLEALGAKSSKAKSSKPSASRDFVRDLVRQAFTEKDMYQKDELAAAVSERLKHAGYSRVGMALRLKEVLAEDIVSNEHDGIRMQSVADVIEVIDESQIKLEIQQ